MWRQKLVRKVWRLKKEGKETTSLLNPLDAPEYKAEEERGSGGYPPEGFTIFDPRSHHSFIYFFCIIPTTSWDPETSKSLSWTSSKGARRV